MSNPFEFVVYKAIACPKATGDVKTNLANREKAIDDAAAEAAAEAKASGLAKLLGLGLTEAEANALIK